MVETAKFLSSEVTSAIPRLVDRTSKQFELVLHLGSRLPCRAGRDAAPEAAPEHTPEHAESAPAPAAVSPVAHIAIADEPQPAANGSALPSADELAIPGYDQLAASQVVPRLAGLTAEELDLIRAYEAGNRQRRTILGRIAQLQ